MTIQQIDISVKTWEDSEVPENPTEPHLACLLLLDTSSSMAGEPIRSLNEGVNKFITETMLDEQAKKRVDLAIVSFGGTVEIVRSFRPLSKMDPVTLTANGGTPMGEGILTAIEMVRNQGHIYDDVGIPKFKPWIFMITDGEPTDSIQEAAEKIREKENQGDHGRLKFFAVGVPGYSPVKMYQLTNRVIELKATDFNSIFNWLADSMTTISDSRTDQEARVSRLPQDARKADPDRDIDEDWD